MIIRHGGHIFGSIHKVRKGLWTFFFLIALFGMLIGWAGNLRSRGLPSVPLARNSQAHCLHNFACQ